MDALVDRLGRNRRAGPPDAATARLLDLIREFDAREGWGNGFAPCAAWLSWRVGLDAGRAGARAGSESNGTPPLLAGALARGELSYEGACLTRVATQRPRAALAVGAPAPRTSSVLCAAALRGPDRRGAEDARRHRACALHIYTDVDFTVVIRGCLTPEAGAARASANGGPRSPVSAHPRPGVLRPVRRLRGDADVREQQADALGSVETAPHHGLDPGPGRALSGRRPCRRTGAGGSRSARPVRPRKRHARFRGNATPGMHASRG
jgi:hypothetical protein